MKNSVVLINPPFSLEDRYGKDMEQFGAVTEPLGLAYIAGYLVSKNISVRIIDAPAEKLSGDDIINSILNKGENIIGIGLYNWGLTSLPKAIKSSSSPPTSRSWTASG